MAQLNGVSVAGVYETGQGDLSERSQAEVWWECVRGACDDAGLSLGDIDGLLGPGPDGVGLRGPMPAAALGDLLGRPLRFHAASFVGAAASAAEFNLAAYAVSHGLAEAVVICNAVAGQSRGYASTNRDEAVAQMAKLSGPYEYPYGTTRVSDYAVMAMRHMYEYGTTSEQLAEIAVAQRHGATLHPLSVHGSRGEITVEDVVSSASGGRSAARVGLLRYQSGWWRGCHYGGGPGPGSGASRAGGVVGLRGGSRASRRPRARSSLAEFPAVTVAADTAFGMAGVSRGEIDVASISDHFTISVLMVLEDAGFCPKGEGGSFVENGTLAIGGSLPTNTAGGFLSFSHAGFCGIFSLIELVQQLRHEAGARQVARRPARLPAWHRWGHAVPLRCGLGKGVT